MAIIGTNNRSSRTYTHTVVKYKSNEKTHKIQMSIKDGYFNGRTPTPVFFEALFERIEPDSVILDIERRTL